MAVGDVTSNEKGSGARFNDGKPDYSLIPLRVIAEAYEGQYREGDRRANIVQVLAIVGAFQERQTLSGLHGAFMALAPNYLDDCAKVFEYGKNKYAAWNWAKGMPWSVPIACIGRHSMALLRGECLDIESGLPHEGHILCNIVMLIYYKEHYPEGDDRMTLAEDKDAKQTK